MDSDNTAGAAGESPDGAGDLFTARIHGLVDMQGEVRAQVSEWAERQEARTEDRTARLAVESVRSVLLLKIAELTEPEEQSEHNARDAREARESEAAREEREADEPCEASGEDAARDAHDVGHARGAHDSGHVRGAQDEAPSPMPPERESLRNAWGAGSTWQALSSFY